MANVEIVQKKHGIRASLIADSHEKGFLDLNGELSIATNYDQVRFLAEFFKQAQEELFEMKINEIKNR